MIQLKDLKEIRKQQTILKYPNVPLHGIPTKTYSEKDTNSLTEAVVDCIDLHGGWATRVSTEGRYIESLGRRIPSSVKKGTSDIIGCYNGLFIAAEIKHVATNDKQSDKQKEVQKKVTAAKGRYVIVSCWLDFATFFDSLLTEGGTK